MTVSQSPFFICIIIFLQYQYAAGGDLLLEIHQGYAIYAPWQGRRYHKFLVDKARLDVHIVLENQLPVAVVKQQCVIPGIDTIHCNSHGMPSLHRHRVEPKSFPDGADRE